MQTRVATAPELIVIQYLEARKIPFEFQTSLAGGLFELGGAVVDFIIPGGIAWRVMGTYWHRGVQKSGSDLIQKENLAAMGLTVIDLQEDDLNNRLEETMRLALRGEEML